MLYYLTVVVFAMVGLNYAVVPLYRTLCQTTGYGGTVQRKEAGVYFNKLQCFGFKEQRLLSGEQIDMPVFFYFDPEFEIEFETDPRMDGINNLLFYTFFKASEETSTNTASNNSYVLVQETT